ncbi:MAG: protoglobin domain-containing protein, partial [Thermoplasmata archaeon]
AVLQDDPQTAPYVEGRVEQLKKTHIAWMNELFSGDYGPEFIQRQERIGDVHVKVRVPPLFVAASMSFLRATFPTIVAKNVHDHDLAGKAVGSLLRLLDLCQYLIDRKYNGTLMENLGISPALLTRLQTIAK